MYMHCIISILHIHRMDQNEILSCPLVHPWVEKLALGSLLHRKILLTVPMYPIVFFL